MKNPFKHTRQGPHEDIVNGLQGA